MISGSTLPAVISTDSQKNNLFFCVCGKYDIIKTILFLEVFNGCH